MIINYINQFKSLLIYYKSFFFRKKIDNKSLFRASLRFNIVFLIAFNIYLILLLVLHWDKSKVCKNCACVTEFNLLKQCLVFHIAACCVLQPCAVQELSSAS